MNTGAVLKPNEEVVRLLNALLNQNDGKVVVVVPQLREPYAFRGPVSSGHSSYP